MREVSAQNELPRWAAGSNSFLGQSQQQQPQQQQPLSQGHIQQALASFLGMGQPQAVTNFQQVRMPGQSPGPLGGVDIPPASMGDPFGGIRGEVQAGDFHTSPFGLAQIAGFGQNPSFGGAAFGGTQLPTWWTNYPGVGNVPFAVPNTPGGWVASPGDDLGRTHMPLSNV